MKKIEHYVCEICGTEYKEKGNAERCEKGHKKIKSIKSARYQPISVNRKGYPNRITVIMENGDEVEHGR